MNIPDDLASVLHVGGITECISVPAASADRAIQRLRTCHDHVFIVDQAWGRTNRINIGVSPRGAECLHDEFPDIEEIPPK